MIKTMLEPSNDQFENRGHQISDAESVMNNFMEKLDNGNLTRDKEPELGEELISDDKFIAGQVESYKQLCKRLCKIKMP